jgi:hypothetical protein
VHDDEVRKAAVLVGATIAMVALLVWAQRAFGLNSVAFALVVVWGPMTWLGTVSHFVHVRLPAGCHVLRGFERDGRVYERLGVRLAKRLLRRGPLAVFNPGLRLPDEPTPAAVARLDQRMRDAEATHLILFVLTLALVVHAALRGWWLTAGVTLGVDVVVNGYPVMLQRYNRGLLRRRFGSPSPDHPGDGHER